MRDRNQTGNVKYHRPGFSPRKVIEVPERVHWEDEVPDGKRRKVNKHPKYVDNFSRGDQDKDSRETDDRNEEHERDGFFKCIGWVEDHADDERICERDGDGEDDSTEQVHKHDELHREAERPAEVAYAHQFHKVVDRTINPPTALRKEHGKRVGGHGAAFGLRAEHHLAVRERAEENGGQETIFTKQK